MEKDYTVIYSDYRSLTPDITYIKCHPKNLLLYLVGLEKVHYIFEGKNINVKYLLNECKPITVRNKDKFFTPYELGTNFKASLYSVVYNNTVSRRLKKHIYSHEKVMEKMAKKIMLNYSLDY